MRRNEGGHCLSNGILYRSVHKIVILIAHLQTSMCLVSSGARCIIFGFSLHLHPYFVRAKK